MFEKNFFLGPVGNVKEVGGNFRKIPVKNRYLVMCIFLLF